MAPEQIFSTRVEQKISGIMVCALHLEQFLVAKQNIYALQKQKVTFGSKG